MVLGVLVFTERVVSGTIEMTAWLGVVYVR
jgi:hypothetical protein